MMMMFTPQLFNKLVHILVSKLVNIGSNIRGHLVPNWWHNGARFDEYFSAKMVGILMPKLVGKFVPKPVGISVPKWCAHLC